MLWPGQKKVTATFPLNIYIPNSKITNAVTTWSFCDLCGSPTGEHRQKKVTATVFAKSSDIKSKRRGIAHLQLLGKLAVACGEASPEKVTATF